TRIGSHGASGGLPAAKLIFFFQAEDGIRDRTVTGVQTCALPISVHLDLLHDHVTAVGGRDVIVKKIQMDRMKEADAREVIRWEEIGRASCRERVEMAAMDRAGKKKGR